MSGFWVGDDIGRVLGPITLEVIRDLLSRGRLQGLTQASRDGKSWVPLLELPEIAQLLAAKPPASASSASSSASSAAEARVAAEVSRLTGRRPFEILGVPAGATLAEARQAFFAKVKPYHPSQLPTGASEKLKAVNAQLFELLSSAMTQFQRELVAATPAAAPPAAQPSFGAESFGGWRRESGEKVCVELNITNAHATIFTDVPAASIANGGFFLPCEKPLPLFQPVEVTLRFQAPTREITGAGRIVCEVNLVKKRGVGVRFVALGAEDKRFIEYFVRRSQLDKPR